ncbi:MAG: helix-turn-helix domain-containing protein [Anaerolineae bacterium]|nr:helix-turn-helix domain-containing protein [Anaerolineae bacterium]
MSSNLKLFREFLLNEIQKRDMSIREFASWLGINNSSINKYLDTKENRVPSLETLAIIAQKTGTPVDVLFGMIYPEVDEKFLRIDAKTMRIAQQITQLPPEKREIVEAFILGTILQQSNKRE